MSDRYQLLKCSQDGALLTVVIDNPPINLFTPALFGEFAELFTELASNPTVTVVVVKSANPDFFIAHYDVSELLTMAAVPRADAIAAIRGFHSLCQGIPQLPQVFIAQVEGRVGGGGAELVSWFDMRFGVRGRTLWNQMEVPLGIIPGGSGTQLLPRLAGHARALEIILGGQDIDAETAERWGLLNRSYEAAEVDGAVAALARRIAAAPPEAVRAAKSAVYHRGSLAERLEADAELFVRVAQSDAAQRQMRAFLDMGGQTPDGEKRVAELTERLVRDFAARD
ncbi:enoyl-CoA hydratase [Mycobacterium intermedium]|uniref:Enoyl-CoA hydratase n=1 Tax=Mycobacterium intermedium TaxID=28445 RepID=A0A1E3S9D8_MYCIE|nr:enoyl-CoA hydratase/isomerase family protein [Mycobacterium intermedium]MCV6966583.1 enoyl-CoA hydratase/isomerase family protein [Mycobacterium intermedium]ODQ98773.1 enoyl-CoA hydratase [Mycobacterium intermedium]OPE49862.1 enoyl-CoA hydratase [Mycobacterium intermedium]ORB04689.1 enoyl-CoA hydratase [Mycobacterium intermedium]